MHVHFSFFNQGLEHSQQTSKEGNIVGDLLAISFQYGPLLSGLGCPPLKKPSTKARYYIFLSLSLSLSCFLPPLFFILNSSLILTFLAFFSLLSLFAHWCAHAHPFFFLKKTAFNIWCLFPVCFHRETVHSKPSFRFFLLCCCCLIDFTSLFWIVFLKSALN